MQDFINVTGMILKQTPVGEYDRRICLLTKERGKIAAFVKGSRKPGSRLCNATNPFSFGVFKLYEGKSSYNVAEADISNYFEPLRTDYIGACYGMYFAEIADYYARENSDEKQLLLLMYQSLRALSADSIPNELVRCVFEIRSIAINGEFPGISEGEKLLEATKYAIEYIVFSRIEKLYTFSVTEEVLQQLTEQSAILCRKCMDREFKSLEILKTLC